MLDMFHVERRRIGLSIGELNAEACGHLSVLIPI